MSVTPMRVELAEVGARLIDSLQLSQTATYPVALALKNSGVDYVAVYLGVAKEDQVSALVQAGLGVIGVTLADRFDGAAAVAQAQAVGLPPGTSLFLDFEGIGDLGNEPHYEGAVDNTFCGPVIAAGYLPGLYVGAQQPFTSAELFARRVVRYWKSQSRVVDRHNALAEPECGWCMTQVWPSRVWRGTGIDVDVNIVGQDFHGRVPAVAVAS